MKRKRIALFEKRAYYGYVFIAPLILGVCFVFLPNLVQTFRYSVSSAASDVGAALRFTGFHAYKEALTEDPSFVPLLVANLRNMVIQVPVILIYSLFISTLLNQRFHGRVLARVIFFVPVILAAGALSATDSFALYYSGAGQVIDTGMASGTAVLADMSSLLTKMNFPSVLTDIVVDTVSNVYEVARSSGLQIFIFLAGLQEIPTSVYEAAQIEGCSKWETFWKITLPMISPQIAVNAIYTIAASADSGNTLLTYANDLAFGENQFTLATAMNLLYLLALGIISVAVLLILKKFTVNAEG